MLPAHRWFDRLARIGFATKGGVYALVGGLAIAYAVSGDGKITGSEGALKTVATQPYGRILLILIAVGLFGYALWRCAQALLNTEGSPRNIKGFFLRIGFGISGLIHAALGWLAVQLARGKGGGGEGKTWLVQLLHSGWGRVGIGIAGAIVIGVGIAQLWKAYRADFKDNLARERMTPGERRWVERLGRCGLGARGVILPIIGFFLVRAAVGLGSVRDADLDGALHAVASQPFGAMLLFFVALGMVAYGGYMFAWARYRRTP